MATSRKNIQVILPAHNEEGNIIPIYQELISVLNKHPYNFSLIFVDDGSTDYTLQKILDLSAKDDRIKYLQLSRNFGHQNAIKAGLDYCNADILIMMDCDLQHPPDLLSQMIHLYESGYEIVRTRRRSLSTQGYFKRKTSGLFYRLLNHFSDIRLEEGSADFRLISGKAIVHLKDFNEFDLFYRGLIKWMGYNQASLEYDPCDRYTGETKYTYRKMFSFGLKGFTSFSVRPLYFAAFLGIFFAMLSVLYIPYIIYALYKNMAVNGWASVVASVVFFGSLNLTVLGIIGIYISKIFHQVKGRPHYLIRETNL